jgi:hypothetical protein
MSMTRLQLRDTIKGIVRREDKDSLINTGLNLALQAISKRATFREQVVESDSTLTSGSSSIALPTGTRRVRTVIVLDGSQPYQLVLKTKGFIRDRWPDTSQLAAGDPEVGYIEGSNLYVLPKASSDLSLRWTVEKNLTEFSTDSDTCECPLLDEALIAWASCFIFKLTQQLEDAAVWNGTYEMALQSAISEDRKIGGVDIRAQEFVRASSTERSVVINPYDPFSGLRRSYYGS